MPHTRSRYIETPLRKLLNLSPLVGILGHRQVGKTTLLEGVATHYFTLDATQALKEANQDPERFVREKKGPCTALDECQLAPPLFPALKEWVRKHKRPGQFLMSGSVRFTSRDAIRESLTGRIMNLELLPFSVSELLGDPLPSFCHEALESEDLSSLLKRHPYSLLKVKKYHTHMERYFKHGGLPGVCFIRDEKLRNSKIDEQLQTILDRDLRLVKKILVSLTDIRRVVSILAKNQGEPLNYSSLKKECGLSTPTLKKLIYALEAVFVLRTISIEGSTHGTTYFFEDQGEVNRLIEGKADLQSGLLHFAFTNIRPQFEYRLGDSTRMFQYRTRGGAFVPLCFASKSGILGIIPLKTPEELNRVSGTISSFLSAYGSGKILLLHPKLESPRMVKARVLLAPMGYVVS